MLIRQRLRTVPSTRLEPAPLRGRRCMWVLVDRCHHHLVERVLLFVPIPCGWHRLETLVWFGVILFQDLYTPSMFPVTGGGKMLCIERVVCDSWCAVWMAAHRCTPDGGSTRRRWVEYGNFDAG